MSATPNATLQERWSEEHFQGMVELWKLTEKEESQMKSLQGSLSDIDHWRNDPYEVIRYYKEYKGNLKQTEKMFRYMIQYRREHDLDSFLQNYGEPDPLFHHMPMAVLDGMDQDGDPIFVDRVGVADSWGLLKHFGIDAMADYILFDRELTNWRPFWKPYEDKVGHRVRNCTVIIDLHGLSPGHMRPGLLALLQRTARLTQDCYAGWAKRIILLRAPSIFEIIWSIARHFFDQHTQDLIVFANQNDYLEVLQEYIELEALPPCMVGEKGKGKPLPGYYENVCLIGGPIPKPSEVQAKGTIKVGQYLDLRRLESSVSCLSSGSDRDENDINVSAKIMGKGRFEMNHDRYSFTVTTCSSSSESI